MPATAHARWTRAARPPTRSRTTTKDRVRDFARAPREHGSISRVRRQSLLVRLVTGDDEVPQPRATFAHGLDSRRELAVVDQPNEVGVLEQIGELLLDVAVVHVDGYGAHLEAREH